MASLFLISSVCLYILHYFHFFAPTSFREMENYGCVNIYVQFMLYCFGGGISSRLRCVFMNSVRPRLFGAVSERNSWNRTANTKPTAAVLMQKKGYNINGKF